MSWLDPLDRRFPRFAFGRRVPPRQMVHRLWLRWRDRLFGVRFASLSIQTRLKPAAALPSPVFPPRPIDARATDAGWLFAFLHRPVAMPPVIDWQAPGTSPRDQLWRMNLHYFEYLEVLPCAEGALLIDQWIVHNPVSRPAALSDAWNSYALSLRVVCWIHWLATYGDAVPIARREAMEKSLLQQMAFLETHLELDLGGNHLIKNIKALIIAAAAFDGLDAARWHTLGLRLLRRELTRQILPDGVHFELSPSYHCQVAADLMEIYAALPPSDRPPLTAPLLAMVRAASLFAHGDGLSALFNDAGLHMAYPPPAIVAAAELLGLARAPDVDRQTDWLDASGFLAWHDQGDSLIVKAKYIAPDALPAHGHADLGSFELSIGGHRCIVDQGVFEYVDGPHRQTSRSAASHNVVQVGDMDQADFFGEFRMGWRASGKADATITDDNHVCLTVAHTAFADACGMVQRTIEAQPGRMVVTDQIERATELPVVTRLLLHPDWEARVEEGTLWLARIGATLRLFVEGAAISIEAARWWPDMGADVATTRLHLHWHSAATAAKLTLSWDKRASP